jgi:hypothetical protein
VGRESDVEGARIVPRSEKRIEDGASEIALLAGWYAELLSGSSVSVEGGWSQESADGSCDISGK